ncbi:MAG: hypothetical protein GY780_08015 [bacterium]|nr:hypothetical protein [bacterium]
MNSTIRFEDDQEWDIEMTTLSMSAAWSLNEKWTLSAAGGILFDGGLNYVNQPSNDFEPGGLLAFGAEYRALPSRGAKPSLDLSLALGALWSETIAPGNENKISYSAGDARLGARFGWIVKNKTFPYLAARVFGGPVSWSISGEDVTGTDIHHYQLAMGIGAHLGKLSIFSEWAGVGEKALTFGMSAAF